MAQHDSRNVLFNRYKPMRAPECIDLGWKSTTRCARVLLASDLLTAKHSARYLLDGGRATAAAETLDNAESAVAKSSRLYPASDAEFGLEHRCRRLDRVSLFPLTCWIPISQVGWVCCFLWSMIYWFSLWDLWKTVIDLRILFWEYWDEIEV